MTTPSSDSIPPHAQLIQMGTAFWASRTLLAAAKLELADHLADGPKSAEELAATLNLHAPSLHRLMRTLASLGVLTEQEQQRFALTPMGEALKKGAPGSARASILTLCGDWMDAAFANMDYSIRTGKPAFDHVYGMPVFAYLGQNPEAASMFSETMVGFHGQEPPAVAAAYDFSGFETIVDVGGATGNMLAEILTRHPGPRGILMDLPHTVAEAPALLKARNVQDRVEIVPGNFFEAVPAGGDAYILSHIIHDWTEEQCLTILANVKQAMKPGARLLLVEMVLPEGDTPHPGKMLDLIMMLLPGGQERTEAEYSALLAKAGFQLTRVIPTQSAVSIVEAVVT